MVIFYVTKLAISLPALLVLGNRIVICTVKCIVIIVFIVKAIITSILVIITCILQVCFH